MKPQQRRVFLKVIAVSPLIGCGGTDLAGPGASAGSAGNAAGGTGGSGSGPSVSGGGNASHSGGASTGGSLVAPGGQAGAPVASGAGPGGTGAVGNPNDPAGPIGNVSAYPLGSFSIAGNIYLLGHDAGGLYAMSMQCTHKFCAVEMVGSELKCPCHFSRFDHLGNVLAGPATTPLPHYKVSVDATGNITVDRFTIVSMSARTPV